MNEKHKPNDLFDAPNILLPLKKEKMKELFPIKSWKFLEIHHRDELKLLEVVVFPVEQSSNRVFGLYQ
jgi:hypothetical protein